MYSFIYIPLIFILIYMPTTFAAFAAEKISTKMQVIVDVDKVRVEPFIQTMPFLARLVSRKTGVISARVSGPVQEFKVEVGDRVKIGQVIALLESERTELEVKLRNAEVSRDQAIYKAALAQEKLRSQELKRLKKLRKSAAFHQANYSDKLLEVQEAQAQVAKADASVTRSRAALHHAKVNLRDSRVIAPYDGTIVKRHTEIGSYVKVGDPVVTLIDDHFLEIEADIPSERLQGLSPTAEIVAWILNGERLKAKVRAIVPSENVLTRTQVVRFIPVFANGQPEQLAANQSITLEIPVGKQGNVLTVHKDALLNRQGKTMVYRLLNGKAKPTLVKLGDAIGQRFVVLHGLIEGDTVVIRGNERLRPDQPIKAGNES